MTEIQIAKNVLPNVPQDVFEQFLHPLIDEIGWPFTNVLMPLDNTEWSRIFHPLTLLAFSQLEWVRHKFVLKKESLHPSSFSDIACVVANKHQDIYALFGRNSQPCRNSLLWHEKFIQETGSFSAPITIVFTPLGFKVIDGNHRIAALFTLSLMDVFTVDAWVGFDNETIKTIQAYNQEDTPA